MDYLASARFSGHVFGTVDQIFEALYKKSHNGTLDGLEAMRDTEYHKRFPNPVRVEAYKPTEKRSICNQFDGQEFECDSVSSSVGKGRRLPLLQLPSRVHRPHLFHCVAA